MDDLAPDPELVAYFQNLQRSVEDLAVLCEARGWRTPKAALTAASSALGLGHALAREDADSRPVMPAGALRKGDFMTCQSGKRFWIFDPRASECELTDMACSLSKIARWGGHLPRTYTVGEHTFRVAALVEYLVEIVTPAFPEELKSIAVDYAFAHDLREAYTGDMLRPHKRGLKVWNAVELGVHAVILEYIGLLPEPSEVLEIVKTADTAVLYMEAEVFFKDNPFTDGYGPGHHPADMAIGPDITPEMRAAAGFDLALGGDSPCPVPKKYGKVTGFNFFLASQQVLEEMLRTVLASLVTTHTVAAAKRAAAAVPSNKDNDPTPVPGRSWRQVAAAPERQMDDGDFDLEKRLADAEAKSRRNQK